ncbi:Beta-fructofuranosidase protein [Dioscorea alata]|uniref:Beta-fructofuranosidase protein n=1 Tax=Dioscorea alata TaxID=55571 RepID=A0ACB7VZ55_DIOAL|nr:Beta-fructofuranosidase protein [Dioscorea alata]
MANPHQSNPIWLLILFCCYYFILSEKVEVVEATRRNFFNPQSSDSTIVSNVYRTSYHFQPPHNWINDPNGPMYYKGIYHLFYQYNPKAALWGNITWGHSVSTDMINWIPLDIALNPTKPFDIDGCWSGSATILPSLNKPVILYTGSNQEKHQAQNIAFPKNLSDPYLKEWIKPDEYNPVMSATGDINPLQFRDPTTGWMGSDGYWRVALGAEIGGVGMALLYKSKDFVEWERADKPLHSPRGSGMWECPDFYPVAMEGKRGMETSVNSEYVKHVLKMSLGETHSDHYLLGRYDEEKDMFIQDNEEKEKNYRFWRRYDYGNFYASKTFFDAGKERRILWGWSNESDSKPDDEAKGWAGIQTIPRMVWLDENGKQLVQWPIKELESLRRKRVQFHDKELKAGGLLNIKGVKASQVDVDVEFELASLEKAEPFDSALELDPQVLCEKENFSTQRGIGPFGLLVMTSLNKDELTAIYFKIFKAHDRHVVLMCSDQRRSSLRSGLYLPVYGAFVDIDIEKERRISLRTLVDHSVVESYGGGGRACMTARVYPVFLVTSQANLHAFNNGSETVRILDLNAWNMAKPSINVPQDQFLV